MDEVYTCAVEPVHYFCTLHGASLAFVFWFCQPITVELRFTCSALIGPLVIIRSLITVCWPCPFPLGKEPGKNHANTAIATTPATNTAKLTANATTPVPITFNAVSGNYTMT